MLDSKTEIAPLDFHRRQDFMKDISETCGEKYHAWLTSVPLILGILRTVLFMAYPTVSAYTIDRDAIVEAKKTEGVTLKEGQFVSTNDIITSWFLRLCGSKYGMMAFSYRNRNPKYETALAGNYEVMMFYTDREFAAPIGIRESLTTFNKDVRFPTVLESMGFNIPVVTNWSTFYTDVNLVGGAVQTIHFPLITVDGCLIRDMCVVFNTKKDQLGVMLFTRSKLDVEKFLSNGTATFKLLEKRIA